MEINADFDKRVVVHSASQEWLASPMPGVDRRPLDRIGEEVARATTIVRYAPGSEFSPHVHTGGEEFLVLEGVFQDEHGDFPTGSYIRNPPQSKHKPGSENGCVIFVKLWQFDLDDRVQVRARSDYIPQVPHRDQPGVSVTPLFQDTRETVTIQHWEEKAEVTQSFPGGVELLVLDGSIRDGKDVLVKHSWLRLPAGATLNAVAGDKGARVWMKAGHLNYVQRDINNLNSHAAKR
ncbi:cupin domain-containing protein [Aestuariibacter salexigens]|uniref:cupin domain-containing protein n=1 Tax=Aestuariibacter salexigens TaxID=226010 RepID=UPI0004131F8C|nr:cupin domain-containing protein [Aestuariibacter salexigens]